MAAKLRKGDKVVVLTGKDKGKQGEITTVSPKDNAAIVDGVNIAIRHTKQSATSQGGRIAKAMPIDLSNLALVDANGKKPIDLLSTSGAGGAGANAGGRGRGGAPAPGAAAGGAGRGGLVRAGAAAGASQTARAARGVRAPLSTERMLRW